MGRLTAIVWTGVVLASACAGRRVEVTGSAPDDPATAVLGATPRVIPGEEATYLLHMREVPIGRLAMQVSPGEQPDGVEVAWVSTVIETAGVLELVMSLRDEVSTLLDLSTGQPLATRGAFVEPLTGRPDAGVEAAWVSPPGEHNGHTLLALRGWDPAPGTRVVHHPAQPHQLQPGRAALRRPRAARHRAGHLAGGAGRRHHPGRVERARALPLRDVVADDTSRAVLRLDSDTDVGLVASARIADYATPAER